MEDLKLIMVFVFRANDGCYKDHNNRDQDFISVKLVFLLSPLRKGILTRKSARSDEI